MAYSIGSLIGGLIITGLLTRFFVRKTGRTRRGALKAFAYTAAICLGLGSIFMGPAEAIVTYMPALIVWLIVDLARAVPSQLSDG